MHDPSPAFIDCWAAAGLHLEAQAQDGALAWLKATPTPPFLEHLSFRLGNQLFFVRVEDADRRLTVPGSLRGLLTVAEGCNGHACLLPMQRAGGAWTPVRGGWGLVDARTGRPVDPFALVTDARIEMTEWELQDFAVQVVRDRLERDGRSLMSWQGNPAVDPSIWFVGDSGGPEWVVVRPAKFPAMRAEVPANLTEIAQGCARTGEVGHFASVAVVCVDAMFDDDGDIDDDTIEETDDAEPLPIWRGHAMDVAFDGLERVWPDARPMDIVTS